MLGKGWFPAELGGLDRYYRELLLATPEATGVVVGPGDDAPRRVTLASDHDEPLIRRLAAVLRATRRRSSSAQLTDVHFALYAVVPLLCGVLRRQPLIVHFHGPWAAESVAAGEPKNWRIALKQRLERAVYQRADVLITLTNAFATVLVENYDVPAERVRVIGPGVNTSHFTPGARHAARRRLNLQNDDFLVCCARRLVPRMGLDVLLDAWSQSLAGDPRARLIIAGGGPLQDELETRVQNRDWSAQVTIAGRISDDDLLNLYRAADLNVVPSLAFEGFGLIVLEAAACGTPSVVTDAGGLPESVSGLGDGLVVAANDAGALAVRLLQARTGQLPDRATTLAWARAQSWERVAAVHRALYRNQAAES